MVVPSFAFNDMASKYALYLKILRSPITFRQRHSYSNSYHRFCYRVTYTFIGEEAEDLCNTNSILMQESEVTAKPNPNVADVCPVNQRTFRSES